MSFKMYICNSKYLSFPLFIQFFERMDWNVIFPGLLFFRRCQKPYTKTEYEKFWSCPWWYAFDLRFCHSNALSQEGRYTHWFLFFPSVKLHNLWVERTRTSKKSQFCPCMLYLQENYHFSKSFFWPVIVNMNWAPGFCIFQ